MLGAVSVRGAASGDIPLGGTNSTPSAPRHQRVAWVTGAASGIGRAAAVELAQAGWTVWASDVDADALRELAGTHTGLRTAPVDVCDADALAAVAGQIEAANGRLDALVASAAVFPRRSLSAMRADDIARVFAVNVVGVAAAVLAARRLMAGRGGSMVLLTSGAAARAGARSSLQRGFAEYGASKAALERWTLGVCDELAEDRIAVHLLCPGVVVDSPGVRAVLSPDESAGAVAPTVVARAVVRLCERTDVAFTGGRYLATELDQAWS